MAAVGTALQQVCEEDKQSESRREIKAGLVYTTFLFACSMYSVQCSACPKYKFYFWRYLDFFLRKYFHQWLVSADVELIGVKRGS